MTEELQSDEFLEKMASSTLWFMLTNFDERLEIWIDGKTYLGPDPEKTEINDYAEFLQLVIEIWDSPSLKGRCAWCGIEIVNGLFKNRTPVWTDMNGEAICGKRPYTTDPMLHRPV